MTAPPIVVLDEDESHVGRRRRRRRFRLAGVVLMIYGAFGIALLALGAISLGGPLRQVGGITGGIPEQRQALLDSLQTTSRTIDSASRSVGNIGSSLDQARTSTDRAAGIARETSGTMAELSRAMGLTILGAQPLIGLAPPFERAGQQLGQLAIDLEGIGSALQANRNDTATMAGNLTALRDNVRQLTTLVEETPLDVSAGAVGTLSLVLYALVGWLLALAFGSFFAGVALWRAAGPRL